MTSEKLRSIADAVLENARRQTSVSPRDVRAALDDAGLPAAQWKEVINLLGDSVRLFRGRYYPAANGASREYQSEHQNDRRDEPRTPFERRLRVSFEDGRQSLVLCKDVSAAGICLVADQSLLGKKLTVEMPVESQPNKPLLVNVRVVWTTETADGMYENGGTVLADETR